MYSTALTWMDWWASNIPVSQFTSIHSWRKNLSGQPRPTVLDSKILHSVSMVGVDLLPPGGLQQDWCSRFGKNEELSAQLQSSPLQLSASEREWIENQTGPKCGGEIQKVVLSVMKHIKAVSCFNSYFTLQFHWIGAGSQKIGWSMHTGKNK